MRILKANVAEPVQEQVATEQEIVNVKDTLLWIEPFTWGDKVGNKIYFLSAKSSASYWHFATGIIYCNASSEEYNHFKNAEEVRFNSRN